jgi:hypothetical protein
MGQEMKDKLIAFDDRELRDWLISLIEDGPAYFLCALSEAAVTPNAEDYNLIRPALIELKRKYRLEAQKRVPDRIFTTRRSMPPETHGIRRQTQ